MFPGMRQRFKVYPCPLEGEAPSVVDQYVAQRAWNCAGEVQLDICYVLFRGWRANSDGRRTSAKSTHRLPKPLAILNEAIESEGHYLNRCSLYRACANGHFKPAMARQQGRLSHVHVNANAEVRVPPLQLARPRRLSSPISVVRGAAVRTYV